MNKKIPEGFIVTLLLALTLAAQAAPESKRGSPEARGPLRVHPDNPRYFTDGTRTTLGTLKAVYLTGSHHWHNLQDAGRIDGPVTRTFDYEGYLEFLTKHNHNFIRLWAWEGAAWQRGAQPANPGRHATPGSLCPERDGFAERPRQCALRDLQ